MSDQPPLPRFRKPPVSEVAMGVQFQLPVLTPVHLGLYYQKIKSQFPLQEVKPPLPPAFETFDAVPSTPFPFPFPTMGAMLPRMWFGSQDGSSLIQLQSGRLFFNWRDGMQQSSYPHFNAVQLEFMKALDELNSLTNEEGLGEVNINQCELVYVNPLPVSATGASLSEPQRIFRVWSGTHGNEWQEPIEDIAFNVRYRFNDDAGNPFGRLTAAVTSGIAADGSPALQLEITARGRPMGDGRSGVLRFHEHAHRAIVRCFTAITTTEMHERWERYQ